MRCSNVPVFLDRVWLDFDFFWYEDCTCKTNLVPVNLFLAQPYPLKTPEHWNKKINLCNQGLTSLFSVVVPITKFQM